MHYYRFNIGDYKSHTSHLDPLEDIAYRRMLDYCYLNEIGLPESLEEIGRLISMRTHCDCIANVLREFFYIENCVYKNKRVEIDLHDFKSKSEKAASSAKEKWRKHRLSGAANAERTQCENDANAMLTNNHKPITNNHIINTPDESVDSSKSVALKIKTEYNYDDLISIGINETIARDFILHRKSKKSKLTETAWNGIVREAEKANLTIQQALQICIERDWKSFKADWVRNTDNGARITFHELATGQKPEF